MKQVYIHKSCGDESQALGSYFHVLAHSHRVNLVEDNAVSVGNLLHCLIDHPNVHRGVQMPEGQQNMCC